MEDLINFLSVNTTVIYVVWYCGELKCGWRNRVVVANLSVSGRREGAFVGGGSCTSGGLVPVPLFFSSSPRLVVVILSG